MSLNTKGIRLTIPLEHKEIDKLRRENNILRAELVRWHSFRDSTSVKLSDGHIWMKVPTFGIGKK